MNIKKLCICSLLIATSIFAGCGNNTADTDAKVFN